MDITHENHRRGGALKKFILRAAGSLLLGVAAPAIAQNLPGPADPVEGHRLALTLCSACHVVAADQEDLPLRDPAAPPFQSIANKPGVTAESLRHFMLTTHKTMSSKPTYTMPSQDLADYQLNAIVAYLMSLRKQP